MEDFENQLPETVAREGESLPAEAPEAEEPISPAGEEPVPSAEQPEDAETFPDALPEERSGQEAAAPDNEMPAAPDVPAETPDDAPAEESAEAFAEAPAEESACEPAAEAASIPEELPDEPLLESWEAAKELWEESHEPEEPLDAAETEQPVTDWDLPAEEAAPEAPPDPGTLVVDIRFRSGGKNYFFDPGSLTIAAGDDVVIETSRGPEFGTCAVGNHRVPSQEIVPPLRTVLRLATAADQRIAADCREKEKKAYAVCQQKILEHKLDMQLVSAECAFDGSKILFFFTADGRVDFRELVKNLASIFRTRIELRQIGVRDKAKMVGGLGVCGRPFCCSQFLSDFQPVSIKMAKTQNLSLNPTKISGTCGRLMCCLKYEQDAYEDLLKTSPKAESFVDTPDGRGTVIDVNLLRQSVRVRMEDQPDTIGTYQNSDICVLRNGKAKKNDPPIPRELAPISSQKRPARPAPKDDLPVLQPIIFHSDAAATVVPNPAEEEAAAAEEVREPGSAPSGRSRRRRKKAPGAPSPASAAEAAPEKPEQPSPHEDAPPDEGGEKRSSSRRRYRRRKPKTPGAPETAG